MEQRRGERDEHWVRIEQLAAALTRGERDAWQEFWLLLEPELKRWLGRPGFLGGLSRLDEAADVVSLRCMESLLREDFRRLRMYFEGPRARKSFRSWMRTVLKNAGIDYIRSRSEYDRRRQSQGDAKGQPRGWATKLRLSTSAGMGARRPAVTDQTTARELIVFAMRTVSPRDIEAFALWEQGKGHDEIRDTLGCASVDEARALVAPVLKVVALEMWLEGAEFTAIAEDLRLDGAAAAQRLVDAAKEQIRRHFRKANS